MEDGRSRAGLPAGFFFILQQDILTRFSTTHSIAASPRNTSSMSHSILWLDEIDRTCAAQVGGKGANLGELKRHGLPVPDGFVLAAGVYSRAIQRDAVQEQFRAQLMRLDWSDHQALERAYKEFRQTILSLPLDAEAALAGAHSQLLARHPGWKWVAVRSSATAEDSEHASFAGQHGTYYYVSAEELARQVRHCWASMWSPEAMLYRHTRHMDHLSVSMAVVVQLLVPADVSGVTFTANPVTGNAGEIIIESSWGLGAAIVDGKVTPDRFVVEKSSRRVTQRRLAEKQVMVPPPDGPAPAHRLVDVPFDKKLSWTLDDTQLHTVSDVAARVEQIYGAPQDIEWALAGDEFYLLQARPITTLAQAAQAPPTGDVWLLAKPIIENFTDPISPMMQSVVDRLPPLCWLFSFHYGRLYVNLTRIRRLFFPQAASWEELERLFDLNPTDPRPRPRLSRWKLLLWFPALLFEAFLVSLALLRLRRMPDNAMDSYRARCDAVERDTAAGPAQARRRLALHLAMDNPIIVNVISAVTSWVLHSFSHSLLRRWAPDVHPGALALAATSEIGVLSAETGKRIWELARIADQSPEVRRLVLETPDSELPAQLAAAPSARPFADELAKFLALHGHRGFKEVEIKNKRWVEEPAAVYSMIRNHLRQPLDLEALEKRNARARAEALDGILRRLEKHPRRQRFLRKLIARTAHFSKLRENSRFYWILGQFAIRKKLLHLDHEWRSRRWLKCEDDIFFLRLEELPQVDNGKLRGEALESLVAGRRREYTTYMKLTPPRLLGIELEAESPGRVLKGVSASPGIHAGRARIILNPALNCRLERGEVLVAPYTDPAWTPLFLQAGAVVVEVGSFLSHAGTVAREYGLPAVVDVRDCTSLIRDGQNVTVDANRSLVILDEDPDSPAAS